MSNHLINMDTPEKKGLVSAFLPHKNQIKYPELNPGLYVFVQHKLTKQIFPWRTQTGHGHPFVANLINQSMALQKDDFSWVGLAGELAIGCESELLGYAVHTGYFHEKLNLTEPSNDDPLYPLYMSRINNILDDAGLPPSRFFNIKTWENVVFNQENRQLFFTYDGSFQKMSQEQLHTLQQSFKCQLNEKTRNFFHGLLSAIAGQHIPNARFGQLASCPATLFQGALPAEKREEAKDLVRFFSTQTSNVKPSSIPAQSRVMEVEPEHGFGL